VTREYGDTESEVRGARGYKDLFLCLSACVRACGCESNDCVYIARYTHIANRIRHTNATNASRSFGHFSVKIHRRPRLLDRLSGPSNDTTHFIRKHAPIRDLLTRLYVPLRSTSGQFHDIIIIIIDLREDEREREAGEGGRDDSVVSQSSERVSIAASRVTGHLPRTPM